MKKIVMAEFLEYESDFKVGSHHYAKLFSQNGYEVLWLSPMHNFLIKLKNKKIYKKRKRLNKNKFLSLDKNIKGYSPYSLMLYGNFPLCNTKIANKLSVLGTIPSIKSRLKENNFLDVDVLWLTNPKYYHLINIINYKTLIYRCSDDFSQFKNSSNTSLLFFEKEIIKKADKVFVTSLNLLNKKKILRKDVEYLPNGVEIDNFIKNSYQVPKEFKNVKNKKCMYVGAIDYWFDLELVKYCATNLKNIEFYLIGPVKIDVNSIKGLENVHVLGKKPYKDIPNYLYYSDTGIIPFKINELTNSIAPIKLYEYMSVGLNVVSTKFKEISYIDSPAYLAEDKEKFIKLILNSIENNLNSKDKNREFALINTWKKRSEKIINYLNQK